MSRLRRLSTLPSTCSTGCPASSVMSESSPRRNMRSRITYIFIAFRSGAVLAASGRHGTLAPGQPQSGRMNQKDRRALALLLVVEVASPSLDEPHVNTSFVFRAGITRHETD